MCGIAGFVGRNKSKNEIINIIDGMIDAAKWRGPDGKGLYTDFFGEYAVGIAHRRLSIIDLSDLGKQPQESPDGRYVISYNGEIYNYKSLKNDLEKKGYRFISNCDTEVVLNACIEYGVENAVTLFNGMWAFAFYDRQTHILTLSRDRFGVKPLYYSHNEQGFFFASDIKALYTVNVENRSINFNALHGFLWNMYIPQPYTIFKDINKLEAGSILRFHIEEQGAKADSYWDVAQFRQKMDYSYEEYLKEIENILSDAVKLRLVADVPVGVFLSGGIDSSLIASLAQTKSSQIINTYSIGFKEKKNDDAKVASQVAKIIGTDHHELYCTQKEALELIELIPDAYAEPFADNSQIPTMLLSRLTKQHVTVALSGDGGDELFIGYPSYVFDDKLLSKRRKLGFVPGILKTAATPMSMYSHNKWKVNKLYHADSITNMLNLDYITAAPLIESLFDNFKHNTGVYDQYGGNVYENSGLPMVRSSVLQSIKYRLSEDILTKVDRASMRYSLECRCPILDYRLAELAMTAPNQYNLHNGVLKAPLKDILYKYVPKEVVERPKSGFGIPINEWLHNDLKDIVNDNLSHELIQRQGIFSIVGISRFQVEFNRQRNPILDRIAYTLLIFQLWWRRYYDNVKMV